METLVTTQDNKPLQAAKKPAGPAFMFALTLFLLVLVGTVGLKIYTFALDKKLEGISVEITETQNTISQTKQKNPAVNAYSLWSKAKVSIEKEIVLSQAQRYLTQLDTIARAFYRKVAFSGFEYADGKVQTNAVAFGASSDAASNVVELLRNYRGDPKVPDVVFALEPILSLAGDATRREFAITFDVRPTSPTTLSGGVSTIASASGAIY